MYGECKEGWRMIFILYILIFIEKNIYLNYVVEFYNVVIECNFMKSIELKFFI